MTRRNHGRGEVRERNPHGAATANCTGYGSHTALIATALNMAELKRLMEREHHAETPQEKEARYNRKRQHDSEHCQDKQPSQKIQRNDNKRAKGKNRKSENELKKSARLEKASATVATDNADLGRLMGEEWNRLLVAAETPEAREARLHRKRQLDSQQRQNEEPSRRADTA